MYEFFNHNDHMLRCWVLWWLYQVKTR